MAPADLGGSTLNNYEDDPRFEAALARCANRITAGEPIEAALTAAPTEYRDELRSLLAAGAQLGALAGEPSPAFARALEARLLVAVDSERATQGRPSWWTRLASSAAVRLVTAAVLALVILLTSGIFVTQASADSLPGDSLYPVRQAREWVSLKLSHSAEQRLDAHAGRLENRGADLERALNNKQRQQVVDTLAHQAAGSAEAMVDQALQERANGRPGAALRAIVTLRRGQERLMRLEAIARPEVRPPIEQLRMRLSEDEARLVAGARGAGGLRGTRLRR